MEGERRRTNLASPFRPRPCGSRYGLQLYTPIWAKMSRAAGNKATDSDALRHPGRRAVRSQCVTRVALKRNSRSPNDNQGRAHGRGGAYPSFVALGISAKYRSMFPECSKRRAVGRAASLYQYRARPIQDGPLSIYDFSFVVGKALFHRSIRSVSVAAARRIHPRNASADTLASCIRGADAETWAPEFYPFLEMETCPLALKVSVWRAKSSARVRARVWGARQRPGPPTQRTMTRRPREYTTPR